MVDLTASKMGSLPTQGQGEKEREEDNKKVVSPRGARGHRFDECRNGGMAIHNAPSWKTDGGSLYNTTLLQQVV